MRAFRSKRPVEQPNNSLERTGDFAGFARGGEFCGFSARRKAANPGRSARSRYMDLSHGIN